MAITVKNRHVGIAPRKMRSVCDLIRRKPASVALNTLRFCDKREIALTLTKLINSGLEIASNSQKYDLDNLIIDELMVDEGPTLKRIQPRAQGRAFRINKRQSHVTLTLNEKQEG